VQLAAERVRQLLQHVIYLLPTAKPGSISETLRAAAMLGVRPTEVELQQLMQHFFQALPAAKDVHVADALRAAAIWSVPLTPGEVRRLVRHLVSLLPHVSPYGVATTLWAVCVLGVRPSDGQLQQLMQHMAQMSSIHLCHVSMTLCALAELKHTATSDQLHHLLGCLQRQLLDAPPRDIARALSACGHLRFTPLQLLLTFEQQLAQVGALVAGLTPKHAATIARACDQLGHKGTALPGMLLQQAVSRLQDGNAEMYDVPSLALFSWSPAVLDLQQYVPHVLQLAAACKPKWDSATPTAMNQLFQVHLWLQGIQTPATVPASHAKGLLTVLSQQEVQQCQDSWEQALAEGLESADTSRLQRSMFAAAQAQPEGTWQHPPVWQQRTADGAFSIDVAATSSSGVRLAIELVKPNHSVQPAGTFSGPVQFRHRALAARGYVPVSVSILDWDKLRDAQQRQEFLLVRVQSALQSAVAPNSS
jgi:hypothetical protein